MVRVVLIPFTTTPPKQQLEGTERDIADHRLATAKMGAKKCAAELIKMGVRLRNAYDDEFPAIIARVRQVIPEAMTRVQRSYAWLITATLKVLHLPWVEYITVLTPS